MREQSAAAAFSFVFLTLWRVCPWRSCLHSWSLLWLSTHRGTKVTGEGGKKKSSHLVGECSTVPESQSPLHLSEHAHSVTSCLWLDVRGRRVESSGRDGRGSCNIRVLFVRFLFLMFLSFCTIIPFFISYVFSSFWRLLFTVKMCPSVSPRWESVDSAKSCVKIGMGEEFKGRGEQVGEVKRVKTGYKVMVSFRWNICLLAGFPCDIVTATKVWPTLKVLMVKT